MPRRAGVKPAKPALTSDSSLSSLNGIEEEDDFIVTSSAKNTSAQLSTLQATPERASRKRKIPAESSSNPKGVRAAADSTTKGSSSQRQAQQANGTRAVRGKLSSKKRTKLDTITLEEVELEAAESQSAETPQRKSPKKSKKAAKPGPASEGEAGGSDTPQNAGRTKKTEAEAVNGLTEDLDEGPVTPRSKRKAKKEAKQDQEPTTPGSKRKIKKEIAHEDIEPETPAQAKPRAKGRTPQSRRRTATAKDKKNIEANSDAEIEKEETEKPPEKVKRKRKTKEEKDAEAMPLAARTMGLKMYIGAHVSCAKGVQNAVTNSLHIGGNAFALFLKSQRKWENPALQDEHATQFHANCREHAYEAASHVLPHGSYLVNLAQKEPDKATQAYDCFLDDLKRCERLGIKLYNFHPGSTGPHPRSEAIHRIATQLNKAHRATSSVKTVLENMAGAGNVIGSRFEDLRDIIDLVEDKARVGVCLDTCHAFAAGYDLRHPTAFQSTLTHFDTTIGLHYLSALHLNDSKAPFSAHRDLHQNIGLGFLGLRAFHNVMNEARFEGLPMVLETPCEGPDGKEDKKVWAVEIKLLEGLMGMDVEGEEFGRLERELAERGRVERGKYQEVFERKVEKEEKKRVKLEGGGKGRGKKKGKGLESEESSGSAVD
ncbi:MAG: hypothetical protein M1817_002112 [Caeruleum heppii]|nr:MAG: hypothetical protein M1817_002112 [Caeruleum heppii]